MELKWNQQQVFLFYFLLPLETMATFQLNNSTGLIFSSFSFLPFLLLLISFMNENTKSLAVENSIYPSPSALLHSLIIVLYSLPISHFSASWEALCSCRVAPFVFGWFCDCRFKWSFLNQARFYLEFQAFNFLEIFVSQKNIWINRSVQKPRNNYFISPSNYTSIRQNYTFFNSHDH